MRGILEANNRDILREIKSLKLRLQNAVIPYELEKYYDWLMSFLSEEETAITENLRYLSLGVDSILSEIMEQTQSVTRNIRVLSSKYMSPISRYSASDNICIKFLKWLHDQHPQSKDTPFAVSDGIFSIYASSEIPIIYYLPTSSQNSVIHLALFFHEFGHYLFEYHRKEMNDYIEVMQEGLEEILLQPFQQNDSKSHRDKLKIKNIIETWYDWIEEIFCDLVGLTIGGVAFLKTFSLYLRMSGREAFFLNNAELENRSHPISRIRIKFIIEKAHKLGLSEAASQLEHEWNAMAKLLNITPVYHGYYSPSYDNLINEALDCMLEEANPINFSCYLSPQGTADDNFIMLLNTAWSKLEKNHADFENWEKNVLNKYTNNVLEHPILLPEI